MRTATVSLSQAGAVSGRAEEETHYPTHWSDVSDASSRLTPLGVSAATRPRGGFGAARSLFSAVSQRTLCGVWCGFSRPRRVALVRMRYLSSAEDFSAKYLVRCSGR